MGKRLIKYMWSNGQEFVSQWMAWCFFLFILSSFLAVANSDRSDNPYGFLPWICILGLFISPFMPMMFLGKEADKPCQPVVRRLSDLRLCPILPDGSIGEPRD
jgi:hypothetical protein